MCTLTVIPTDSRQEPGLRIACNRDEGRNRPVALPPQRRQYGARTALLPIDPQGGGTWIGVNDAGLAMSLLNYYPQSPRPRPDNALSRGLIIPGLLHLDSADAAGGRVADLDCRRFPPFRLVMIDRRSIGQATFDGMRLRLTAWPFDGRPQFFTSSGLGDHLVDAPRRTLFHTFFDRAPADLAARQDAFHRHSWPDRTHLSVCMRRAEALTVSLTVIETGPRHVRMTYVGDAPDGGAAAVQVELVPAATIPAL